MMVGVEVENGFEFIRCERWNVRRAEDRLKASEDLIAGLHDLAPNGRLLHRREKVSEFCDRRSLIRDSHWGIISATQLRALLLPFIVFPIRAKRVVSCQPLKTA